VPVVAGLVEEGGVCHPVEGDRGGHAAEHRQGEAARGMRDSLGPSQVRQGYGDRVFRLGGAGEVADPRLDAQGLVVVGQGLLRLAVKAAGAAQAGQKARARVLVRRSLELHQRPLELLQRAP
jgi:hypothetical protein